jgi:protein subunit release factor A
MERAQGRVTDHRIGLTIGDIDRFMQGERLGELIGGLVEHEQSAALDEWLEDASLNKA